MNRTVPAAWKPTKAQLLAAHNKLVPDLVARNLIVLFAGLNPGLTPPPSATTSDAPATASGPHSTAAASPRVSSHLLKDSSFSTSNTASPTSSNAPPPAPMNSPTTNFVPEASASKPKSNGGPAPRSSPSSASAPTASSPALKDARVGPKGPLRRQPRLGPPQPQRPQRPLPARHPRTTLPEISASGPLHSTGVDEMPAKRDRPIPVECVQRTGHKTLSLVRCASLQRTPREGRRLFGTMPVRSSTCSSNQQATASPRARTSCAPSS